MIIGWVIIGKCSNGIHTHTSKDQNYTIITINATKAYDTKVFIFRLKKRTLNNEARKGRRLN